MDKMVYSVQEAASKLGISKGLAYQLVKERRLPVLDLGKRKVIPIVALERWIQENTEMRKEKSLI